MKKGSRHTEKTKRKLSQSHKGQRAWNKGLTKKTSELVRKNSRHLKGRKMTKDWREKMRKAKLGTKQSKTTIQKRLNTIKKRKLSKIN